MHTEIAEKPRKRTQERTEVTRKKLLKAAAALFMEQGYDGVTVRDIEKKAVVHRGLAAYHFHDKASLWKAVADKKFGNMRDEIDQRLSILSEVSPRERLATIVRFYVQFNARDPGVSALMSQEARKHSWRIQYLIDRHVRSGCHALESLVHDTLGLDRDAFIHWYYIMISASSTIFYFAPECQLLFDVDSREEALIKRHADLLVAMLVEDRL